MDLDTLLDATAAVAEPSPEALRAAGTTLATATAESTRLVGAVRRRRTRRVALVAAAASLVLIVPTLDLGSSRPRASAEAAELLLRAGQAAGAQPGDWRDAAYWHSVSTHHQGSGPTYRREIWIGHHAIGVLKDDGVDQAILPLEVASFPAGARGLSWDALYALPTAAEALERELRDGIDGAGPDDDSELFTIVGDLLRESPAPPALRKALWEVAAGIPGVTLVGSVTDAAGRPGTAVERNGQRYVLDPSNGRLLEESSGDPAPSAEAPGGSDWRSTYLEQGPADSAPDPTYVDPKRK